MFYMEKIVITKANKKDIPRIVEVHRKCVSTTNLKNYTVDYIPSLYSTVLIYSHHLHPGVPSGTGPFKSFEISPIKL